MFINTDELLPAEQIELTKLARGAANIAYHNFEWRYITLVFFNSAIIHGVQKFISTYEKSQIIVHGFAHPQHVHQTHQFVLFGDTITEIINLLDSMSVHELDNTGKYIIICESKINAHCDEEEAADVFWSHKIINVVFLKHHANSKELNGYVYQFNKNCHSIRPYKLNSLNNCLNINQTECKGMFPIKLANLYKCPITVSTFARTPYMKIEHGKPRGADGDLLRLIADGLNATLIMMTPRRGDGWGRLGKDGYWFGSLADVYDDVANFSMTSGALTLSRFSYFQMSIDYYATKIVWITHHASMKHSSLKLLYPYKASTQVVVIISFVFVVICTVFIRNQFWSKFNQSIKLYEPIFYFWMIFMGLPATYLPRKLRALIIVMLWMWYCFLLRTTYQVFLITSLQNNYYYAEIETIEEAYKAQYRFGGGAALKDYYIDYPLIYEGWQELKTADIIPTLLKLNDGLQFVLAMNLETATAIIRKYNIRAHILSQRIVSSPTVIFFKKYSPLAKSVNHVLRQLVEAGFPDKTYKDNVNIKISRKDNVGHQPINTQNYTGCYVILFFGWIISFLLFLLELCVNKLNNT